MEAEFTCPVIDELETDYTGWTLFSALFTRLYNFYCAFGYNRQVSLFFLVSILFLLVFFLFLFCILFWVLHKNRRTKKLLEHYVNVCG